MISNSSNQPILTVETVCGYIQGVFNAEELLHNVLVVGEISGISLSGETAYFTLKDSGGQLPCVCFNIFDTYKPKSGDKVVVRGSAAFYPRGGKMSFNVYAIEPEGMGEQFAKLEQLKEKLAAEGLFDTERKKRIPSVVKNLCVITSVKGAVVFDILSTVRKYSAIMNITIIDARVQGDYAVSTIVNALTEADKLGFDVIIVARGGGSFEELSPFNEEILVRAVAKCQTPTISAVGHETDYTLCDFAASERALTPTAAAEAVAQGLGALENQIRTMPERINAAFHYAIVARLNDVKQTTRHIVGYFREAVLRKLAEVDGITAALEAKNPQKLMRTGYVIAENDKGRVTSAKALKSGDEITLHFTDGIVRATVSRTEPETSQV